MRKLAISGLLALSSVVAVVGTACENKIALAPVDALTEDSESIPEDQHRGVYFVAPVGEEGSSTETLLQATAAPTRRILFMNRDGGTYRVGRNNSSTNVSSVPTQTSTLPKYEGSEQDWAEIMTCMKEQYARFNVDVTDVDPGNVAHVESVMSGRPEMIGMGPGTGGVAPVAGDCSIIERAIVYTFTQVYSRPRDECETAAQESAHAFGLDHEFECTDPMTYLSGCGTKVFQPKDALCGEYSPRQCMCGGATQNSVVLLTGKLGAAQAPPPPVVTPPQSEDQTAPVVSVRSPADGSFAAENTTFGVSVTATDAGGLAKVELLWQFNGTVVIDCANPASGAQCTQNGDTFTWAFKVGTGPRSFQIRATDTAGNVTTTVARGVTFGAEALPPVSADAAVVVTSPADGAGLAKGSTIQVRATMRDDVETNIAQVVATWTLPSGTQRSFNLVNLDGSTWGLDLVTSRTAVPGTRIVRVVATDRQGNKLQASDVRIELN